MDQNTNHYKWTAGLSVTPHASGALWLFGDLNEEIVGHLSKHRHDVDQRVI